MPSPLLMATGVTAVFLIVKSGFCVPVTVSETMPETIAPLLADAVLVTLPAFRSANVTVYVPVQVMKVAGGSPPTGNAGHATDAILLSDTVIGAVSVVLPVLVTL